MKIELDYCLILGFWLLFLFYHLMVYAFMEGKIIAGFLAGSHVGLSRRCRIQVSVEFHFMQHKFHLLFCLAFFSQMASLFGI